MLPLKETLINKWAKPEASDAAEALITVDLEVGFESKSGESNGAFELRTLWGCTAEPLEMWDGLLDSNELASSFSGNLNVTVFFGDFDARFKIPFFEGVRWFSGLVSFPTFYGLVSWE